MPAQAASPPAVTDPAEPGYVGALVCAECHSTNLRKGYDLATDSFRTTWSEIDVACEACHGPGAHHVAQARSDRGDGTPAWDRDLGIATWGSRSRSAKTRARSGSRTQRPGNPDARPRARRSASSTSAPAATHDGACSARA